MYIVCTVYIYKYQVSAIATRGELLEGSNRPCNGTLLRVLPTMTYLKSRAGIPERRIRAYRRNERFIIATCNWKRISFGKFEGTGNALREFCVLPVGANVEHVVSYSFFLSLYFSFTLGDVIDNL